MTIWDCRTHVRMTSMTSSVERTDLDFKISVALLKPVTESHIETNWWRMLISRGETIPRNYGAPRFSGQDSVHDYLQVLIRFSSLKCKQKLSVNCQLDR